MRGEAFVGRLAAQPGSGSGPGTEDTDGVGMKTRTASDAETPAKTNGVSTQERSRDAAAGSAVLTC